MTDKEQVDRLIKATEAAEKQGHLSTTSVNNIRRWLTSDSYAEYFNDLAEHIGDQNWQQLEDVFYTVIPFGTGGRRGTMYPIGTNAINDRTIGESAQGLANYIRSMNLTGPLRCAIAYDTRHNSIHFSRLCSGIMVAAGFQVFLLDDYRSTPELSFLVRNKACHCGIMVTASHNPPSDNAVKVYWDTGGQILPPHDKNIIDEVGRVDEITRVDFEEALAAGQITVVTSETDEAYLDVVIEQRFEGPRDLKVIYSPLHGVGEVSVAAALKRDGFDSVEVFELHRERSGDFPNVPDHVSNPENTAVFEKPIEYAQAVGGELILATDPDCDRMGCAAPKTLATSGEWGTFNGNQIGALLADFILEQRARCGRASADDYVIKTLVTTDMIRRIADSYSVETHSDLLVGFKWICGRMDEVGPENFAFGTEESHGYLVGQYVRDKDGAVACMLMAELVAKLKSEGVSLHEKLESLYWQHGYHAERLLNLRMAGARGMQRMVDLMATMRSAPPTSLGGMDIQQIRDYKHGTIKIVGGETTPLDGPSGDLIFLDLAEAGNTIAVRPSGTEPKVKFYMFGHRVPERIPNMDETRAEVQSRLDQIEADLKVFADNIK
ncbi:MAG TPA: phospho-sugar mutase [Planctomycetaceae bacterium]|nr:phospho-sugar mutase [Planctomycetaceae bacterium]